jgi:hypothetical protein
MLSNITWHAYSGNWDNKWPKSSITDPEGGFPFRSDVRPEYDYMGAEAGVGVASTIGKGIISRTDDDSVDLEYKTKAKAFGYLNAEPTDTDDNATYKADDGYRVPPYYFGLVLPAFHEVRLIHSDIGDPVLSGAFYRHVKNHLHPYLNNGPDACDPGCSYCRLLIIWEGLDWQAGLAWLQEANSKPGSQNPCYVPPPPRNGGGGGGGGGGASGGS